MTKLPYVLALAATAPLLAGCVTTSGTAPEAAPVPATRSSSATAAPSATPAPAESATPAPGVSDSPSSDPMQAPTPEHTATVTTTPADSGTPVTEPPVTEPLADPTTEAPVEPPIVVTPDPTWEEAPRITVRQGSSFTATGSGYQAGQEVFLNMGVYQTDSMVLEEQSVIADATGGYSFTITIGPDLPPQTYGVFTMVRGGAGSGADYEATKQFAIIEVVPA